jgi:lambda family phage portal protein
LARHRLSAAIAADRAVDAAMAKARTEVPLARVHEATRPTRQRRLAVEQGSANRIVTQDAAQLRASARAACRDHDVAKRALSLLVQNTVGSGIDVQPTPRKAGERVDRAIAQALRDLWDDFWDRPEVTWQHDFGKCQQLLAGSWFRDGECYWQQLSGPVASLEHGTIVPFSIELLESDLVPLDLDDDNRNILQGVERNGWGRHVAYHVYKQHPGDGRNWTMETKRVSADFMRQLALLDRIHQVRGLSVFAPVINRLVDIQDYENSERIAAKVAASLCAQIVKGSPELYGSDAGNAALEAAARAVYRSMTMVPGMIGDDLLPGERIEIIDSKRPNPNVATYIGDQLKRVAAGAGVTGSSLSMNYDGTYSAQRQELVEQWGAYAMIGEQFIARVMRPIWRDFVNAAVLSGRVRVPRSWTLRELSAATFVRPVMPWIDPLKEALARGEAEDRGWQAPQQSMLQMGNDPEEVQRLREDWIEQGGALPNAEQPQQDQVADGSASQARRVAVLTHALKDNA